MMGALGTDLKIVLEKLGLEDFSTLSALDPKAFGDFRSPLRYLGLDPGRLKIVKPCHKSCFTNLAGSTGSGNV